MNNSLLCIWSSDSKIRRIPVSLIKATSLRVRMKGLLGRRTMDPNLVIYFPRTFLIHTWAMRFPIDCVFTDSEGNVLKIYVNLPPWTFAGVWNFTASVYEMAAGKLEEWQVNVGDRIYVEDPIS